MRLTALWGQFKCCVACYNDPEAWVAVLTGAGALFVPGLTYGRDRVTLQVAGQEVTFEIPTVNSFESGLELWKPTIAAVNGAVSVTG